MFLKLIFSVFMKRDISNGFVYLFIVEVVMLYEIAFLFFLA